MAKDLCIAIAVSKPDDLDEIPGAIPSAQRIVSWAGSLGYDTELVSDAEAPVTCARLKEVFVRKLGEGGQRRLIVSFAGHGLIRGGAEEYWLLSGWRTQATEAVNHLKLRDRLGTYLPKQLAVISDACRSLPQERARWVEGNGVVDVKEYVEKPVEVAYLAGTRAAQPSFATPIGAEEAYCFFTQVLVNALYGIPDEVVEENPTLGKVVTNDQLFNTVTRELPRLANQYRRNQTPDLLGGWRAPNNVWSVLDKLDAAKLPALSAPPKPRQLRGARLPFAKEVRERAQKAKTQLGDFVSKLNSEARATHFETGTGVVVTGVLTLGNPAVRNFIINKDDGGPAWFRLESQQGAKASPVLVQLADGNWVGAAVYRGFIGTFTVGSSGVDSYVLRPNYGGSGAELEMARAATGATLGDPYDLAAKLRDFKHTDPVLGALAAYAYARAGAIQDIDRLVYFYAQRGQPAPFDAVLLARLEIDRDRHGYMARVPAVAARAPRSEVERSRTWTYQATPATPVRVAGGFPWFRQGWALLEDDFRDPFRKLAKFAPKLAPGIVTTLERKAGAELAELLRNGEI
jgi:hypothetical protein